MQRRIPNEVISEITQQANIVEIINQFLPLQKKGNNYIGLCPFHQDSTPSFTVNEAKKIYKCFACSAGGNIFTFLEKQKNFTFIEALEYVANAIGYNFDFESYKTKYQPRYSSPELEIIENLKITNDFYKSSILSSVSAKEYLNARKFGNIELQNYFDIGFAAPSALLKYFQKLEINTEALVKAGLINQDLHQIFSNRITFGIRNDLGDLVGFSARSISKTQNQAKYINSPETKLFKKSEILYNYFHAKEHFGAKKEIIIVEGFMDVIALHKAGFANTVAIMGVSLTTSHLKLLKNLEIKLFLDNDKAGLSASYKSIKLLLEHNFNVKVVNNTLNKDADEILSAYGATKLQELLANSISAVDYVYNTLKITYKLQNSQDFNAIENMAKELSYIFAKANNKLQEFLVAKFKNEFNYTLEFKNQEETTTQTQEPNNVFEQELNFEPFAPEVPEYNNFYQNNILLDEEPKLNAKIAKQSNVLIVKKFKTKFYKNPEIKYLVMFLKSPKIYQAYFQNSKELSNLFNTSGLKVIKEISSAPLEPSLQAEILQELKTMAQNSISENEKNQITRSNQSEYLNLAWEAFISEIQQEIEYLNQANSQVTKNTFALNLASLTATRHNEIIPMIRSSLQGNLVKNIVNIIHKHKNATLSIRTSKKE